MKVSRAILMGLFLSASLVAASVDLGNSVFYNDEGRINIAADAGVVVRNLDSPYVMFMLYMSADDEVSADVHRDDIVLVYEGKEYAMPPVVELRKKYSNDSRDMELYNRLAKEPLVFSDVKFYRYNFDSDFFPVKKSGVIPRDLGSMYGFIGFRSKVYFENPGFKPGDIVSIKVRDKDDPDIQGGVAIRLGASK